MTHTLDTIKKEELKNERDLDQIENEKKQIRYLEEEYDDFFNNTSSLFENMKEQFLQNDFSHSFREQAADLRQCQHHIFDELEQEQQKKYKEKYLLEEKQNDLYYQRKKILATEEESK